MSIDEVELKCWEYVYLIKDIKLFPKGLYGLDEMRTKLHDLICKKMNLSKERTKKYTDNLEKIDYNGSRLYTALLLESRKKTPQEPTC